MKKQGSITVFLALMLSLLLSLVCTSIESVRMAAARTQILNSMDIGLYSLFGQYDKKLLEDYELFAIDGSFGKGQLDMASVYDDMKSYMVPVLKQNSQNLTLKQGGFTGYRLMTDDNGEPFYAQIVQYMKNSLGSRGIQLLLDKMSERKAKTEEADRNADQAQSGHAIAQYDSEMNNAAQRSRQAEEEAKKKQEQSGNNDFSSGEQLPAAPVKPVENPITVIKKIMKMGILELVLPYGKEISSAEIDKSDVVSTRNLQQGMKMPDGLQTDNSYTSEILFQQYIMDHLGSYANPARYSLAYQAEYIYGGKGNDVDNLKTVASKLLLIREGVNLACLMADGVKRAQAQSLALAIASGFLIPPASVVIESALLLCWSFAESVLDVRELFDGGRIPLVKTSETWQISLENLPLLLDGLDSMRKNDESGLSYEDYLQILLLTRSKRDKVMRTMDMVESVIRKEGGKTLFRMDSCVVAVEAFMDVKANKRKVFNVTRQYCYK